MKQMRMGWKVGAVLGSALICAASAGQARAELLEQNWQPNQKLVYKMSMSGTARLTAPPEMPMVGGLPLEFQLRGDGQSTLEAREVDEFGTALVVPKVDSLNVRFNETTFNQNGSIGFQKGKMNVSVNGQDMSLPTMDWSMLINPTHGLRFTRNLRMTGFQKLDGATSGPQAPSNSKNPLPAELPALLQGMIVQSIPPLLPVQDVNLGDSWKAPVKLPVLPGKAALSGQDQALGEFEFTAISEERIQDRRVWKIAVDGSVKALDVPMQAAENVLKNQRAKSGGELPFKLPQMLSVAQKTKGHVWFDLDAGQIVKSELNIMTQAQARAAGGKDAPGVMYFNGRVTTDLL